jgi:hypothetical protein
VPPFVLSLARFAFCCGSVEAVSENFDTIGNCLIREGDLHAIGFGRYMGFRRFAEELILAVSRAAKWME